MEVKANLRQAFEEILDKMAFLYFEEEPPPDGPYDYITKIGFEGTISGVINIFFTGPAGEQIARNLVGIRPEDELFPGTLEDALCEFTNMVMGRTLTILDPDSRFEMEVPTMLREPTPAAAGMETLILEGMLEEEPCRVLLHFQRSAA